MLRLAYISMNITKEDIDKELGNLRNLVSKFHGDFCDFELCNGYILQATRNYFDSRKFSDGIVIFTKKLYGDNFVVVTSAGTNRAENIYTVAKELFENSSKHVVIKNVGKELESRLLKLGCRHYRVDEWWDDQSKYDDNSFPEQILNAKQSTSLDGPNYKSLREECARFNRGYQIEVKRWNICNPEMTKELLKKWVDNMHIRNDWDKNELHASHEMFCNSREDLIHFGVYDSKNDKLIGFMVFSEVSSKCLGYNVLVSDFEYKNLYRVLMLEGAKIANSLGYQYLNVQGSEDTNQYLSKRRLQSEFEIPKEHLIFDEEGCV